MTKIIGVDIGGTKTSIGIVDIKSGKILKKISIPSKKNANDKKQNRSNDIIGVIYRHPSMNPDDFNENYLRELMHKLAQEKSKNIYITGDFNFNLLNSSNNEETSEFFDLMMSSFLLPTILLPTKINKGPDTLIDNIFSNQYNPDIISGNLTLPISDHLPSFCIFPKPNQNHLPKKHNMYKRDRKNFKDKEDFMLFREDFLEINWFEKLEIEKNDVNYSFNSFYDEIEGLMDKYLPLKKVSKKDYKRNFKPWITHGILTSMKRRDKLFGKYIKAKSPEGKLSLHREYKSLRNKIIFLISESKQTFYSNYFEIGDDGKKSFFDDVIEKICYDMKKIF